MRIILIVTLLCLLNNFTYGIEYDWVLKKEQDSIVIYTSKTDSDFDAYRGETIISTTVESVVSLLKDTKQQHKWMYQTEKVEVIKKEGNASYIYAISKAPWPVQQRDLVTKNVLTKDTITNIVTINMEAVNGIVPKKSKYLRISKMTGKWIIEPINIGKVRVVYQSHSDPGGNIPSWLSNMASWEAPLQTLKNVKEWVKKEPYRSAK